MIVYTYGCKAPADEARAIEILRAANRYRNALVELRQASDACKYLASATADEQLRDSIKPLRAAESRALRAASGLHYGTYLLVEQDARSAKRFRRFDGGGRIGAPLPTSGARTVSDRVLGGSDRNLQILGRVEGTKNWNHARLRIGTDEWLDFRVRIHRPLPPQATVLQAWLQRTPIATHARWELQLVLSLERRVQREPTGRSGAIDIGWRYVESSREDDRDAPALRVAADSDGRSYEIPAALIERVRHAKSIESIRSRAFNDHRPHPAMRSPNRLNRRVRAGEFPELEQWRKQDRHLHDWHEYEHAAALRARKELYRQYAIDLCTRFDTIYLEDFDLKAVARRLRKEQEPDDRERTRENAARARSQRFDAAPGLFRQILRSMADPRGVRIVEVDPAHSNACAECGWWERAKSGRLHVRCPVCERRYDGDVNAAKNLLARGLEMEALANDAAE
jgi:Putative transposase DNA-binding domain